jgi:hypothetical protein
MPKYYFHIDDGSEVRDDDGTELRDLTAAKCEAAKLAGELICHAALEFWNHQKLNVTVTDGAALILFTIHMIGIEAPSIRVPSPAVSA